MRRNAKPVKYGGVWYPSYSALAKAIGTCTHNISQIVHRNGNDLDACGYFDERLIREEGVWYCGEHFKSQRALARHLGVSKNVIQKAVARHGVYLDETKLLPSRSRKGKTVSYCGERFESQAAIARHLCVGEGVVRDAIKKHGDHLDASMFRKEKPWFIYRCNRYVGDEILDKFGMTPGEARRLIEAHGHDLDEAGVVLRELAPRLSVADIQMTKTEEEMFYGSKKCKGVS